MSLPTTSGLSALRPLDNDSVLKPKYNPKSHSSSTASGSNRGRHPRASTCQMDTSADFLYPAPHFSRHPLLSKSKSKSKSRTSDHSSLMVASTTKPTGLASPSVRPLLSLEEPKGILDIGEDEIFADSVAVTSAGVDAVYASHSSSAQYTSSPRSSSSRSKTLFPSHLSHSTHLEEVPSWNTASLKVPAQSASPLSRPSFESSPSQMGSQGSLPIPIPSHLPASQDYHEVPASPSPSPTILFWHGQEYIVSGSRSRTPSLTEDQGESSGEEVSEVEDALWDLELDASRETSRSAVIIREHVVLDEDLQRGRGRQEDRVKPKLKLNMPSPSSNTSNPERAAQSYPSPESSPERRMVSPIAITRASKTKVHRGRSFRRSRA